MVLKISTMWKKTQLCIALWPTSIFKLGLQIFAINLYWKVNTYQTVYKKILPLITGIKRLRKAFLLLKLYSLLVKCTKTMSTLTDKGLSGAYMGFQCHDSAIRNQVSREERMGRFQCLHVISENLSLQC